MTNPTKLIINSPDYTALDANGAPRVAGIQANVSTPATAVVAAGPFTLHAVDLGKPTPDADGIIRYALAGSPIFDLIPLHGGSADITVQEYGPGGFGVLSPIVTVMREAPPAVVAVDLQ